MTQAFCFIFSMLGLWKIAEEPISVAMHHKIRFSKAGKCPYYRPRQHLRRFAMGLTQSLNAVLVGAAFLFVAMMLFI
jgi:hypothetical protein